MASPKPTNQRISVNRQYRTEASRPGGAVLDINLLMMGTNSYGWASGFATARQSGVAKPSGDDIRDILPVTGMYASLGDKQRQSVNVTFDLTPQSFTGAQTVSGQINLSPDLKTGYATFTYSSTSKGDRSLTTVENVKINAVKAESPKE